MSDSDTAGALQVAVVSRSFVERYWPGQNAIGRRFRFGLLGGGSISTIGDFQNRTDRRRRRRRQGARPRAPQRAAGVPAAPPAAGGRHGLVHAAGPRGAAHAASRGADRAGAAADRRAAPIPTLPVTDVRTLAAIVLEGQTAPRRVQVRVLAGFAALAVLLAGVGIHGLLAFAVASRVAGDRRPPRPGRAHARHPRPGAPSRPARSPRVGSRASASASPRPRAAASRRSWRASARATSATFAPAAVLALATALAGSLLPAWRAARVDPLKVIRVD